MGFSANSRCFCLRKRNDSSHTMNLTSGDEKVGYVHSWSAL